ncbi:MAG: VOC family protein [Candidatus Hodarchaeales archaeon]|jgi:predicted enzyme related to lactoylglutathione lyase
MEIVGIEIPVLNLDKGIKFYQNVFGWKIDRETFKGQGYVKLGESVGVNIFQSDKKRPKGLNVGFNVEDIDTSLKNVKQEDGKIVKDKFSYENLGYVAVFQDCFGNELSLFSGK